MEESKLSIKDVLIMTTRLLGSIQIPVALTEDIGLPVVRAIGNLNECIKAIDKSESQREESESGRDSDAE